MNIKKLSMIIAALAILLFICWFYLGLLRSPNPVLNERTTSTEIEKTGLINTKTDEGTPKPL